MKEMFKRQMEGKPQIEIATSRADALWTCAKDAADGKLSGQELEETCWALVDTQIKDAASNGNGLWPVMLVDQMPSEAWVDFVYMPSYAACAILLCGYHQGCVERIPDLESALRNGLAAAFPNGVIASHGNECEETAGKVLALMERCGLQDARHLFELDLRGSVIC